SNRNEKNGSRHNGRYLVCSESPDRTSHQYGYTICSPRTIVTVISAFDNTETGEFENNGETLCRANFNNDGITTFNPSFQGYSRFEGFNNQSITGSIPADFYDVLFRNENSQPAFRLYGNIGISGNADFFQ